MTDLQELFNYLTEEHDIVLLENELHEVYRKCGGYDKDQRIQELEMVASDNKEWFDNLKDDFDRRGELIAELREGLEWLIGFRYDIAKRESAKRYSEGGKKAVAGDEYENLCFWIDKLGLTSPEEENEE